MAPKSSKSTQKILTVAATQELAVSIMKVMAEQGVSQSAAMRLILKTGLDKMEKEAYPREAVSQAYSTSLLCFSKMFGWFIAEAYNADWDPVEIAKIPKRLGRLLGVDPILETADEVRAASVSPEAAEASLAFFNPDNHR